MARPSGGSRPRGEAASTNGTTSMKPASARLSQNDGSVLPAPSRQKCLLKALPDQIARSFTEFQLAGQLKIMPRTNSKTNLHLSIRVSARGKEESQWIRYTQTRNQTRHRVDPPSQQDRRANSCKSPRVGLVNNGKETIFPFGFLDSAGATSLLAILGSPSP